MRDAVAVNTSQEAADKTVQLCFLEHGEDPGVIDTGKDSSKVCQLDTLFLRSTRNMSQGRGLDLKNIVGHLPGGDASL